MRERFGDDAPAKMLAAYADNLITSRAIERSFGVDQDAFDRGYKVYVTKVAAEIRARSKAEPQSPGELQQAYEEKPDDVEIAARLAAAYFNSDMSPQARELADKVLKQQPKHQLAAYVLARLRIRAGESTAAMELLQSSLDRENPQSDHLALLADLTLKAGKLDESAALYELGRQKYAGDKQWAQALARLYLTTGNQQKLAGVLSDLATADAESLLVRKKLAVMAVEQNDWAGAGRWAREATHIDVNDAEMHRISADAAAAQKRYRDAIHAYELAVRLDGRHVAARGGLIRALAAAEQQDKARVELESLKQLAPGDAIIQELEELLKK
jgi:predicted Zn-dependent protease